jgi:hypothetical protein
VANQGKGRIPGTKSSVSAIDSIANKSSKIKTAAEAAVFSEVVFMVRSC